MPITAKEFQHWADTRLSGKSWAIISKASGVKRTTLHQQIVRGRVSETTLVAVARAYALPVVQSLSEFEPYSDLATGIGIVSAEELLSQIIYSDVLKEILQRAGDYSELSELDLRPFPHKDSVRAWVDAIDTGNLRQRVCSTWNIAATNLSAQLRTKLSPELAVSIARHAETAPANGLVVIGLINAEEGAWPVEGRINALRSLADRDLISLAVQKLNVLNRAPGRKGEDESRAEAFWENLG